MVSTLALSGLGPAGMVQIGIRSSLAAGMVAESWSPRGSGTVDI
jgi:hypothetical protein